MSPNRTLHDYPRLLPQGPRSHRRSGSCGHPSPFPGEEMTESMQLPETTRLPTTGAQAHVPSFCPFPPFQKVLVIQLLKDIIQRKMRDPLKLRFELFSIE